MVFFLGRDDDTISFAVSISLVLFPYRRRFRLLLLFSFCR